MSWDILDDDLDPDAVGLRDGESPCPECFLVHKGECF